MGDAGKDDRFFLKENHGEFLEIFIILIFTGTGHLLFSCEKNLLTSASPNVIR
jgi:hypothetical protein